MKSRNPFYSTYRDSTNRHEYDLRQLGEKSWRGFAVAISDGDGNRTGGESFYSLTTQKDYYEACFQAIMKLDPVYKIHDFLNHHFGFFKGSNSDEDNLFIKHIQYVLLPMIKQVKRDEYAELIINWLDTNNKMLLQKQLKEKNEFLRKAYEVAVDYAPSSPLSVSINPREFGASIGFDESTTKRVMNELVQDGYVTSGLGMRVLMVTQDGLSYLRQLEDHQSPLPSINVSVGDNSNFQFQNGTVHSQQRIGVKSNDIEEFKKILQDIKSGFAQFKEYLTPEELENLQAETDYMENNLQRAAPNKSILKTITGNIMDILKSVPANVIANVITDSI